MTIGVFGGTFDPPHVGHLVIAQEVQWRLSLDRILWVPASVPPHKLDRRITRGPLRLRMVRAAIASHPGFETSDLEIRREGRSYTVDTLRELRRLHPGTELVLVLGADQLSEFGSWREPGEITRMARLVAFARAGEWPEEPVMADGETVVVERVEVPRLDISSTEIRRRAETSQPIRFLVPDAVREIVEAERPYDRETEA